MIYPSKNSHISFFRKFLPVRQSLPAIPIGLVLLILGFANSVVLGMSRCPDTKEIWVGTWSTAQQLVEPHNLPPAPGLSNNTLRQVVCVSIGGSRLRIRFSNEFSSQPVTLQAVQIAVSKGNGAIDPATITNLTFNGAAGVTMAPGGAALSDPFAFALQPRMELAITIYFGQTSPDVTGHPGSRTTSYILPGNQISAVDFSNSVKTDHWYVIDGIDVNAPPTAAAVAVLGNSITDGRGSGTNKQNRWTDVLAQRLLENPATRQIGVLNLGIGGNCVLRECLGPSALDRFERDVLNQAGVRWLIILEGINDIGQTASQAAAKRVARDLIDAFEQIIEKAHAAGIRVYGATLLPFGKSFYDTDYREEARQRVNAWIRNSGRFDEVIDFEKALQNPEAPQTILPEAHDGDFLHPSETGHRIMGSAVNLKLFE